MTDPTPSPPSDAGARTHLIPGFEIEGLVGKGGMGAVYRARKLNIGKTVALKVLFPSLAEDPVYAERFEREVRSLARLTHENLVNVLDAGRAGDFRYMVMDFVEGQNLADVVAARGPLPPEQVASVAEQALLGLQFIHEQGMVHRDLKPANFILGVDGVVKICDLGLVRVTGERSELTQQLLLGTPEYISPEQARGDLLLDIRSDLYSLGATLYFLATGRPPHVGESPLQVAQRHLHDPLVPVRRRMPAFPRPLARFIESLLQRRPERRHADPRAALLALRAPARAFSPAAALLAAAAVVAMGAGGWWWWPRGPDLTPTSSPGAAPASQPTPAPLLESRPDVAGSEVEAMDAVAPVTLDAVAGEMKAVREQVHRLQQLRTHLRSARPEELRVLLQAVQRLEQRLQVLEPLVPPPPPGGRRR